MPEKPAKSSTPVIDSEEARDLRNTLIFAGILVAGLGLMILASSPNIANLSIPPLELGLVALTAELVTVAGIAALQFNIPVRSISWAALVIYTILASFTVHYTGGPLTPIPALYLLIAVGASFLLGWRGATVMGILGISCYALVLYLEYSGVLKMVQIWRISFSASERGSLLIINWFALAIPTLVTSQLAGTLAERLKATNASLRESERLRDNLTHMVVHDLRNPLTGLLGWLDILQTVLTNQITPEQGRLLENARRSGHVLLGLVSELLDINKMEAGKLTLHLQSTDFCVLIDETVESLRGSAELEKLTLEVEACEDVMHQVPCDRALMSRVLVNLISNAIKHTPPGGQIKVTARAGENDMVVVSVTDNGIGIASQHQKRIFEKFGQVEVPGQERRGTGLGLTFCKLAVETHNGQIWVDSQVGKGSTFSFTLPLIVE